MDINLNPINGAYSKASSNIGKAGAKFNIPDAKPSAPTRVEAKTDGKSDKVLLSSEATQQYELYKMTKSVMREIENVDINMQVDEVKTQIENNTYDISPDKIAAAVLSRWAM